MSIINEFRKKRAIKELGQERYDRVIEYIVDKILQGKDAESESDIIFVDQLDRYFLREESAKKWAKFYSGVASVCAIIGGAEFMEYLTQTVPLQEDKALAILTAVVTSVLSSIGAIKSCREMMSHRNKIKEEILIKLRESGCAKVDYQKGNMRIGGCEMSASTAYTCAGDAYDHIASM